MKAFQHSSYIGRAIVAAFALTLSVSTGTSAQGLGVAAGLNFDSISDIDRDDRSATFENATGWHIGIFYDLAVGPVAVRPGIFYRQVPGVEVNVAGVGATLRETFDMNLIEVPIDVRLRMMMPLVKPYLMAGPVFSFASTGDEEFEDQIENLSVAANIGLGVEISLPGFTPVLYPELRYAFGISRFMKEDVSIGDVNIGAGDTQRLSTFMLRLGVRF